MLLAFLLLDSYHWFTVFQTGVPLPLPIFICLRGKVFVKKCWNVKTLEHKHAKRENGWFSYQPPWEQQGSRQGIQWSLLSLPGIPLDVIFVLRRTSCKVFIVQTPTKSKSFGSARTRRPRRRICFLWRSMQKRNGIDLLVDLIIVESQCKCKLVTASTQNKHDVSTSDIGGEGKKI